MDNGEEGGERRRGWIMEKWVENGGEGLIMEERGGEWRRGVDNRGQG